MRAPNDFPLTSFLLPLLFSASSTLAQSDPVDPNNHFIVPQLPGGTRDFSENTNWTVGETSKTAWQWKTDKPNVGIFMWQEGDAKVVKSKWVLGTCSLSHFLFVPGGNVPSRIRFCLLTLTSLADCPKASTQSSYSWDGNLGDIVLANGDVAFLSAMDCDDGAAILFKSHYINLVEKGTEPVKGEEAVEEDEEADKIENKDDTVRTSISTEVAAATPAVTSSSTLAGPTSGAVLPVPVAGKEGGSSTSDDGQGGSSTSGEGEGGVNIGAVAGGVGGGVAALAVIGVAGFLLMRRRRRAKSAGSSVDDFLDGRNDTKGTGQPYTYAALPRYTETPSAMATPPPMSSINEKWKVPTHESRGVVSELGGGEAGTRHPNEFISELPADVYPRTSTGRQEMQ